MENIIVGGYLIHTHQTSRPYLMGSVKGNVILSAGLICTPLRADARAPKATREAIQNQRLIVILERYWQQLSGGDAVGIPCRFGAPAQHRHLLELADTSI